MRKHTWEVCEHKRQQVMDSSAGQVCFLFFCESFPVLVSFDGPIFSSYSGRSKGRDASSVSWNWLPTWLSMSQCTQPDPCLKMKMALCLTLNPDLWPTICQHLPSCQPVSLHTCPQKSYQWSLPVLSIKTCPCRDCSIESQPCSATKLQHFTTKSTSERALQRIRNLTNGTIVPSELWNSTRLLDVAVVSANVWKSCLARTVDGCKPGFW